MLEFSGFMKIDFNFGNRWKAKAFGYRRRPSGFGFQPEGRRLLARAFMPCAEYKLRKGYIKTIVGR